MTAYSYKAGPGEEFALAAVRKPRQSDIARVAQVSQATVSMVLNDRATANGIPESTQARIRAAMAKLGYVPNIAARSLRGGRNNLVGVHTFERVFPTEQDDYYNEFLHGIEAQAIDEGLDLVLFASTQRPDGTRSIYGNGVNRLRLADGAVMLGFEQNDDELRRLAAEEYPFVFVGRRTVPGIDIPYVTADYFDAMRAVIALLVEAGHQRATYLGIPERRPPQQERLDGVRHFTAEAGMEAPAVQFLDSTLVGAEWVEGVLAGPTSAVIVESYDLARALHRAVSEAGVQVPEELSVVCLDTDRLQERDVAWSQVAVPRRQMGRVAVSMLLKRIEGEIGPDHVETLLCDPPTVASVAAPARHRGVDLT